MPNSLRIAKGFSGTSASSGHRREFSTRQVFATSLSRPALHRFSAQLQKNSEHFSSSDLPSIHRFFALRVSAHVFSSAVEVVRPSELSTRQAFHGISCAFSIVQVFTGFHVRLALYRFSPQLQRNLAAQFARPSHRLPIRRESLSAPGFDVCTGLQLDCRGFQPARVVVRSDRSSRSTFSQPADQLPTARVTSAVSKYSRRCPRRTSQ